MPPRWCAVQRATARAGRRRFKRVNAPPYQIRDVGYSNNCYSNNCYSRLPRRGGGWSRDLVAQLSEERLAGCVLLHGPASGLRRRGAPGWGGAGRPLHAGNGNGNVASQGLRACFVRASCAFRKSFVRALRTLRMSSRSAAARSRADSALRSASRSASAVACQGAVQLSDICRMEDQIFVGWRNHSRGLSRHCRVSASRGSAKRWLTPYSSLRTGGDRADLAGSKLGPDRPLLVQGLRRRGAFGK